jgi:hypothetical protein
MVLGQNQIKVAAPFYYYFCYPPTYIAFFRIANIVLAHPSWTISKAYHSPSILIARTEYHYSIH